MTTRNRRFYWFGDSWVTGLELEKLVPLTEVNNYLFGKLVSDFFKADFVNKGDPGSSVDIIPYKFTSVVDELQTNDIVFFCLTASLRTSILLDDSTECKTIRPYNESTDAISKFWYKNIDSYQQRLYNYEKVINLLYLWTKELGIKCYFLNLFTVEPKSIFNVIPDKNWLIDRKSCVAQSILHVNDPNNAEIVRNDMPTLKSEDWYYQEQLIKKYIYPCDNHPNILGHQKIADILIEKLNAENQ